MLLVSHVRPYLNFLYERDNEALTAELSGVVNSTVF